MLEKPRRPVDTYQGAELTVDHLSDQGFPMQRVAVIGQDVCLVEQVIGRTDYGRATLHGAASGALPGALIGWLLGLVDWVDPLVSALLVALYGVIFGAVVGALFGLLLTPCEAGGGMTARCGGRTGRVLRLRIGVSPPVRSMQPSRYVVVADAGGPQPAEQPYGLLGDRFVRTSRPYLNDRIRSVGAGRRIGRSSSWPRQWASTWAPPTR
ncbi:YtxH domain-containing protein [Streptomyces sp900116325]|uniref:YtxH domain-containing protein n=1 Tax=Streptomyces sp. 900116325 TaxID=3154295 RepID=UPI0033280189